MISLAAIETNSVAGGFLASDEIVKTADVHLVEATSICPGKFIAVFTGSPAAVRSALDSAALLMSDSRFFFRSLYLANLHESVLPAMGGLPFRVDKALGLFESYSAIDALEMADAAVKHCPVRLHEIRLGRGLGGKSLLTFSADKALVDEAAAFIRTRALARGILSDVVVISNPTRQARRAAAPLGPGYRYLEGQGP